MRFAVICLVACASKPVVVRPAVELESTTPPPPATFRWAVDPLMCEMDGAALRSSVDTCDGLQSLVRYLIAAYAPVSDDDQRIAVIRYDGEHLGAPLRWQQHLDFGAAPHSAVVLSMRDTAIASAISRDGIARVVALDLATGKKLGAQIITEDARAVQLEGDGNFARVHVRTATGGVVAVMHPRTTRIVAQRAVDEAAFVDELPRENFAFAGPVAATADATLRWEANRLVLRSDTWFAFVHMVDHDKDRAKYGVTLTRNGDRLLATVHDERDFRIEVLAFDHATGRRLWRRIVTGGERIAFRHARIGVAVVDDQLVVTGDRPLKFACTIGLADGIERACVDRIF